MGVQADSAEFATFATTQTSHTFYWGSIDGNVCVPGSNSCGNTIQISLAFNGGGSVFTLIGAQLIGMDGVLGQGQQGNPLDNQWVTITGLPAFNMVTFTTTGNAFEFSLPTVPEPSTWALMALGFAGLGYTAFRRNSKARAIAI